MKKLIALLLALALLAGLTACSVTLPETSDATGAKTPETTAAKDPEPAGTKEPAPQTDAPVTEPAPELPAFEEQMLFDTDDCSMKITGIEEDDFWGYILKAQVENKTEDLNLRFSVDTAAVNGVSYDPYFSADAAAGKKANEEISFSDDTLNALLGDFTDIELTLRVYNADDWLSDDILKETVHVYPLGQDKASVFVREAQPTDVVLADNDDFSVIVTGYDPEGFWGYTVKLYLVNKTDIPLCFNADDVSVNGFMCDPYWGKTVEPGKTAFSDMAWSNSDFEEIGVTDVEEVEFSLRVYNADDIWADDLYQEVLTLEP